jgi:Fe2+ or Zn2+ uptake regulation protein
MAPEVGVRTLVKLRGDFHFLQVSLAADYADRLRAAGLRVTRPRIAVLYAAHNCPHSEAETIIRAVHDWLPDVSRQAVYDSLHVLTSAGLLRRVQPSGFVARYESRVGDNHHHMVCRSCGAIADLDCAVGAAPCLTASDATGFQLDEAEVIFWGRCPQCSDADPTQHIGERGTVGDGVRFGSGTQPVPSRHGHSEQTPTTKPRHCVPTSLANSPSTVTEVGTSAPPANAVLISFDVAGAALTGYGRRNGNSLAPSDSEEME